MVHPFRLLPLAALIAVQACSDERAADAAVAVPAPAPAAVAAPVPAETAAPAEETEVAAAPATGPSPIPSGADPAFCEDYEMFSRELALLRQRGEERSSVEAMARTLPDGAAVNSTVALAIIDRAWALPVAGSQAEKDAAVAGFKAEAARDCAAAVGRG